MAEILSIISIISFVLSGICIILAVFIFIKFRIPSVIGDLSHRTARKSIEKIRDYNEKSGAKLYKSSTTNINRGMLTDTMPNFKKESISEVKKAKLSKNDSDPETGLLYDNQAKAVAKEETQLLDNSNETELLDENETELLIENQSKNVDIRTAKKVDFEILDDVVLVHTDEVI
ncbi:MAG: hypothetical protein ACI4RM_08220 [Ruminococcus sp.]